MVPKVLNLCRGEVAFPQSLSEYVLLTVVPPEISLSLGSQSLPNPVD